MRNKSSTRCLCDLVDQAINVRRFVRLITQKKYLRPPDDVVVVGVVGGAVDAPHLLSVQRHSVHRALQTENVNKTSQTTLRVKNTLQFKRKKLQHEDDIERKKEKKN